MNLSYHLNAIKCMSIFRRPNPIQINGRFKSFLIHLCDKQKWQKAQQQQQQRSSSSIFNGINFCYLNEMLFPTYSLAIDKFIATIHNIRQVNWIWSSFCWLLALASASASVLGYCYGVCVFYVSTLTHFR